jgi:hypothetical protein
LANTSSECPDRSERPPLHGTRKNEADRSQTYGSQLRDELVNTPVYVRYNSGLDISDNGRRLADVR